MNKPRCRGNGDTCAPEERKSDQALRCRRGRRHHLAKQKRESSSGRDQTRSEVLETSIYGFYITGVVRANDVTTDWVAQVPFDPQQVVAVRKDQYTRDLIESGGVSSLSFLDTEQEDLARKFTGPLRDEGAVGGSPDVVGEADGVPLFEEAFAHLGYRVVGKIEAGDHTVYLGEVVAANLKRPADIRTGLDTSTNYGG